MTVKTIKLIVFIILSIHAIGHFQGVATATGAKLSRSSSAASWLLNKFLGKNISQIICLLLYFIAAHLGIFAAFSFQGWIFPQHLWQNLVFLTAVFSTIALVLYPNALAMFFNKIGAITVNAIIILSLFWLQWPSVIFGN